MALFGTTATGPLDVGYDVILVFGQSNASGAGGYPDGNFTVERFRQSQPTHPRIYQWGRGISGTQIWNNKIIRADNPLHSVDGIDIASAGSGGFSTAGLTPMTASSGLGVGFALAFAAEYVKTIPTNRNVLIVPCAKGATTIAQWAPTAGSPLCNVLSTSSGLNLFGDMVLRTNAAIASNANNRIVAALFSQGESDIIGLTAGATWTTGAQTLFDSMRSSITGAGSVPILMCPMVTDYWNITYPSGLGSAVSSSAPQGNTTTIAAIQNAIDAMVSSRAYTGVIPSALRTDLTGNGSGWTGTLTAIHFSADAATALGQRLHTNVLPAARANSLSATVPAAPVLGTPGTVTGTGFVDSWSAVTGAAKYTYSYRRTGTTAWTYVFLGNVLTTTLTGLTSAVSYDRRVVALNSAGLASLPGTGTQTTAAATATGFTASPTSASLGNSGVQTFSTGVPAGGQWAAGQQIAIALTGTGTLGTIGNVTNGTLGGSYPNYTITPTAGNSTAVTWDYTGPATGSPAVTQTVTNSGSPTLTVSSGVAAITIVGNATGFTVTPTSASVAASATQDVTITPNGLWQSGMSAGLALSGTPGGAMSAVSGCTVSSGTATPTGTGLTTPMVVRYTASTTTGTETLTVTSNGSTSLSVTGGTVTLTVTAASVFPLTFPGSNGAAPSGNSAMTGFTGGNSAGSANITVDGSGNLSFGTAYNGGYFASTANTGDGAIDITFASGSVRTFNLFVRADSNSQNGYYLSFDTGGGTVHALKKISGGTTTTLLTLSALAGTETSIGLKIVGSVLTYRVNGADTASTYTDGSVLATSASRYVGVEPTNTVLLKLSQITFT